MVALASPRGSSAALGRLDEFGGVMIAPFEVTAIIKEGGALTKRIWLGADGNPKSDGSECVMSRGRARRRRLSGMGQLAELIGGQHANEAIVLGALLPDLPDEVEVVTKHRLNGSARPGLIARTQDFIDFTPGAAAVTLVDFDKKGMPNAVEAQIAAFGGLWTALVSIIPELAEAARVTRLSTSAGLSRSDTGEAIAGSGGVHIYLLVKDGEDGERFLKILHERCWLAGLGWMMVGAGGQLLERSIVDRVVGGPERLSFEGAPVLVPPLVQDQEARRPIAVEGAALDTVAACPPLSILERGRLEQLHAKETHRLAPERAKAREHFIEQQSRRLVERTGMDLYRARRTIERQCEGILLPDLVLLFDDEDLADKTVADVLADPARFEGATLADPLEGIEYGRCKARIMRRADGTPWINSFAHGRTVYELKFDAAAAQAALQKAPRNEIAATFVRLALAGDLGEDEIEDLRNFAHDHGGTSKTALDRELKKAKQQATAQWTQQEHDRRLALRDDPRPLIPVPAKDAEWLPVMGLLNDMLGKSGAVEPPMRDFEGHVAEVRSRTFGGLHVLTTLGSNREDTAETRLPAPEHPLLCRLSETELAELIEGHIEFADEKNRSVHLPESFVKHYLRRADGGLPMVTGVCTLPIVLPGGEIFTGPGLVRRFNTVFRVPVELCALLPDPNDCTPAAVSAAMRFLTHDWLCDVAADYVGRCVLVADALTIIERQIMPMRPAFFIGAGKRGGGKTTTINMISYAVLGQPAAAAAWSPNAEERRKALFAYFLEGVPMLVWDNIARGTTISCPSIEASLTAELYSDRLLGVSEHKLVPVNTIQHFTGNNIAPGGDMSSRGLRVFLDVDRPDPENREFTHPDPIGWTKAHRGQILRALYTVLLGNPRRTGKRAAPETRFKEWHDLVGSAVEFAAEIVSDEIKGLVADAPPQCPPAPISFKGLFLVGEEGDEENAGLAALLAMLQAKWGEISFRASDIAEYLEPENGPPTQEAREMHAVLERAGNKPLRPISPLAVSWRLKKLANAPVRVGNETLVLRRDDTSRNKSDSYCIKRLSR
jgi:hypothetical protein